MRSFLFFLALPLAAVTAFEDGIRLDAPACSKTQHCAVGCCSKFGFCGYGPTYCGSGCQSTCGAKPQCGKYAAPGQTQCPLNICCSQYGSCGFGSDYCGAGCQEGCTFKTPSCSGTSSAGRNIGYFAGYNTGRPCDVVQPGSINVAPWTHLNYAFVVVGSGNTIIATDSPANFRAFTGLKSQKPSLKTFISVGGAGAGGAQFSRMASSQASRKTFIKSVLAFMKKYNFDGVDIDWEFPGPSDTANFVSLVKGMRAAFGTNYGISVTLPVGYGYLQYFNIPGMAPSVDWFNFMAYDIHSYQDGSGIVQPQTNLTEIQAGLDLLWRVNTPPAKVSLGLASYGHSYTLQSSSCTASGCPASGVGVAGNCTESPGILSDYEMAAIMDTQNPKITYNAQAAVNWMSWAGNQWVSYDDAQTYVQKAKAADSQCIGGLFAFSVDFGGPLVSKSPHQLAPAGTGLGPSAPVTTTAGATATAL